MRRGTLVFAHLVLIFSAAAFAAEGSVQLTQKPHAIEVSIDGVPFTVFHFDASQPKPYFWPVYGPHGEVLTRALVKPTDRPRPDHPHHRGLWFSVDEVNDIKFWAEKGKIENVSVEPIVSNGNPARFKIINHWLGKDRQPVLIETTMISIFADRLIAYDADLTPVKSSVQFGDTKEGMFGFRMVSSMRGAQGGRIQNAQGKRGERECWGRTSEWVDYSGTVDGKTVGVTIFDNPHNFRPSRFHVRNYGLFSISPFGESAYTNGKHPAAPLTLKPGSNLRLRYAIYIHEGEGQPADIAAVYKKYVNSAGN